MRLLDRLRRLRSDESGVAAIETALIGSLLAVSLMNVVEVSRYAYVSTQVTAATQAGAQAAIIECDPAETPATLKCSGFQTLVTNAVQGTSLGDTVTVKGALLEKWYCLTTNSALQDMSAAGSKPSNCVGAGLMGAPPALYLTLTTTYTYEPIFPGLTVVQAFDKNIERTTMMRML